MTRRVLFICEGNRARSQLAEAMLRHHGAGSFETFSAGIRPGDVVPDFTIDALEESSYSTAGLRPKHYSEFADEEFDYLIVLCDRVRAENPDLPPARERLDWNIIDPADLQARGMTIDEAIRQNKAELRSQIVRFMAPLNCVFCGILEGSIAGSFIHRDDDIAAFMDIRPVTEGHALIVPIQHHVTMDEVPEDTAGKMVALSGRIAKALEGAVRMDGYNLFVANGEEAGQEVFHVHLHVIPRYRDDGFGFKFPDGYGRLEKRERMDELAAALRASLSGDQA